MHRLSGVETAGESARRSRPRFLVLAAGHGRRLRAETAGRLPKQLLTVGDQTLLGRLLELGCQLRLAPLVVTLASHRAHFAGCGSELLLLGADTPDMLSTLYGARGRVGGDLVWVGGDTLLTDPEPLRALLAEHLAERPYASFLYRRSDRHLAKLALEPVPRLVLTRQGSFPYSLPNFGIHSAAAWGDLALQPRGDYVQRALDRGERILFREYTAPVFEIDCPADLAAARQHYASCSTC
jgi:hypothetical protein